MSDCTESYCITGSNPENISTCCRTKKGGNDVKDILHIREDPLSFFLDMVGRKSEGDCVWVGGATFLRRPASAEASGAARNNRAQLPHCTPPCRRAGATHRHQALPPACPPPPPAHPPAPPQIHNEFGEPYNVVLDDADEDDDALGRHGAPEPMDQAAFERTLLRAEASGADQLRVRLLPPKAPEAQTHPAGWCASCLRPQV